MNKKINLPQLIIFIGIPLLVGSLSSYISGNSMASYQQLNQPTLAPPGWIFPIVWIILFVLMGVASYLVFSASTFTSKDQNDVEKALYMYGLQLTVNFFWSIIFFVGEWYLFAFLWLLLLWVLIVLTIKSFYQISPLAAWLIIPYLLWVTFAGYLNLSIYLLN